MAIIRISIIEKKNVISEIRNAAIDVVVFHNKLDNYAWPGSCS